MEIHWVLGHMSVEGNKISNEATEVAAETRGFRVCPEQFTSLAHIGRTVMERKRKEVKHSFRTRHEGCSHIQ